MQHRKNEGRQMSRNRGFTMAELMLVMVIILILAALAYPSYASHIVKARRLEGQMALLDAMQKQERYYTEHQAYLPFSADSPDPDAQRFKWYSGSRASGSAYELSAHACPGLPLRACIEVRATPGTRRVDQSFRDPDCETLTLKNTGEQGAGGRQARCWP